MVKLLRYVTLIASMVFAAGMLPTMALAQTAAVARCAVGCGAAPAPLIGAGLPVALAIGSVLLAVRWIKRHR